MARYPKPSTSKAPEFQAVPSTLTGSSIGSASSAGTIYHPTFHFRRDYNSASTNSDPNSNPNPLSPRGYSSPLVFEKLRKDEMQSTGSSSTSADHANSAGSLPSPPLIRESCPLHALYNDDRELPFDGEDESGRATGVEKSKDAHERQKPESHGLRLLPWIARRTDSDSPNQSIPILPAQIHARYSPGTLRHSILCRRKGGSSFNTQETIYPSFDYHNRLPSSNQGAEIPPANYKQRKSSEHDNLESSHTNTPLQATKGLRCLSSPLAEILRHREEVVLSEQEADHLLRRVTTEGSSSQHKTVLVNEKYLKSERIREIVTIFKTFGLTCLGSAIVTPELEEYTDQVGFDGVVFFLINTDGRKPQDIPLSEHLAPLTIFHSPTGKFHLFGQQDIEADLGSDLNDQAISKILTASCWL